MLELTEHDEDDRLVINPSYAIEATVGVPPLQAEPSAGVSLLADICALGLAVSFEAPVDISDRFLARRCIGHAA